MYRNKNHVRRLSLLLCLCLFISICFTGPAGSMKTSAPKLSDKKINTETGETFLLKVYGLKSGQKAKWKVSSDGILKKKKATGTSIRLKAVNAGSTKVKAKIGKKALVCKVQVRSKNDSYKDYEEFEDFAGAVSDLLSSYSVQNSAAIAVDDPYYTGRLIAKGMGEGLDFSDCSPDVVLKSDDNIYILQFKTPDAAKTAYQNISNRTDIEWVEADKYIGTQEGGDTFRLQDSSESLSWGVPLLGADSYARKTGSGSITVAVVDTGVSSHPFLNGRLVSGYDYIENDSDPSDRNSHGTHVAGTIVDCTPGLNVKIMPVRVLDASGNGNTSTIALGIRYAVDNGAKVINLSLGGGHSNYMDNYIQYALDHGVSVVVAAGNNYSNTSSFCPAHLMNVIVVGAIDDSETRAYFSNYGNSLDVAAPGVDIVSCVPGGSYASYDGTSMATPHISGIAAMLRINHPDYSPSQIEEMIKSCARDLGTAGWDMYYGYGIPDLSRIDDSAPAPTTSPKPTATAKPTQTPVAPTKSPISSFIPIQTTAPTYNPTPSRAPAVTYNPYPSSVPMPGATSKPIYTQSPIDPVEGAYLYKLQSDMTVLITKYRGSGGDLFIPTELDGFPVSGICDEAFYDNDGITSITINGIIGIGARAFAECDSLSQINIYGIINGVGSCAFANCYNLYEINIWGMVYQVQKDIFSNCPYFHTAYVTGMVDQSVMNAFAACPSLVDIQMSGMVV